ncbi:TPA: hypothetical protein MW256_001900 [Acinetobacter baumannii]|nr:hypothetical protein [Acinetobacter baumannii]
MDLKDKIILNSGETLVEISHKTKGPVGETDIYKYKIINSKGDIVGYVDHTDHTSIRGFQRTQSAIQYDINKRVIIDIHW